MCSGIWLRNQSTLRKWWCWQHLILFWLEDRFILILVVLTTRDYWSVGTHADVSLELDWQGMALIGMTRLRKKKVKSGIGWRIQATNNNNCLEIKDKNFKHRSHEYEIHCNWSAYLPAFASERYKILYFHYEIKKKHGSLFYYVRYFYVAQ